MTTMTTWRKLINELISGRAEDGRPIGSIIHCTLTKEQLDVEFDDGFGCTGGEPFTAWTETHVIFPAIYDGSEWAACVLRNPCDEATNHIGG